MLLKEYWFLFFLVGEFKKSDDCKISKYGCCWDNYISCLDSLGIKGCLGKYRIMFEVIKESCVLDVVMIFC